jgi:2-amino-4-hydroxy-6-hydroxymethyldihydropteridine diphosphokinase
MASSNVTEDPPGKAGVVLGLGSNRGDSRRILGEALEALGELLEELRGASLFETEPLHEKNQARFLNTAAAGVYRGEARELLEEIHRIEARFGRDRSRERRWGERTLDIDILLFGGRLISEPPDLEIPHPRLIERRFALTPLLELCPEAWDPRTGRPYGELLEKLPPQGIYYAGPGGYNGRK